MKPSEQMLRRKHCSQDRIKCVELISSRTCNVVVKFLLHLVTFERRRKIEIVSRQRKTQLTPRSGLQSIRAGLSTSLSGRRSSIFTVFLFISPK